ncbi:MAG: hypothetical protein J0H68_03685 [Sphingobacteriia bacterium]|nr:hypothetical protein [Sphingobacteriia bacterium]
MITDFELAELLQSRIFHDLSGPIGALSNGAEFLREGRNDVVQKAIELMEMSSAQAVARVQYYKMAYGYLPLNAESNVGRLQTAIANYFKNSKTNIEWHTNDTRSEDIKITNGTGKILLVLTLIAANMLIYGGTLEVHLNQNNENFEFTLKGTSANGIKVDRDTVQIIGERNLDLMFNSQNVVSLYALKQCERMNANLSMEFTTNEVKFICNLKQVINNTYEIENASFSTL